MAPPYQENELHTSSSIGFEKVDCEEVDEILKALELLLGKAKTPECKSPLEQLKLFLSKADGANSNYLLINEIYDNLIKSLDKETDLDHLDYTALCQVLGSDKKQAELDDAFDLDDLKGGKIAGFNKEKLLKMLDFSKISYGDKDGKLTQDGYKTKRQLVEEGYQIIQFFEDGRTENQYSPDEDYRLESRNYGYDLICSNSWDRDAGYIFIKGEEVTIAYHGTRDGSDFKTDFDAFLTKLPFLPEDNSVHSGFYSLFKRSWPSVHKILQGYANDKKLAIKDLKINVTGHSMGGALASVAALCLNKTENAENVHVATFGSPRVFYKDAAKVYDECFGKKTIRVACISDNVPCVPFGGSHEYYKHVGQALKLEANVTTLNLLHYHELNTYRNLINELKQESFKSDNASSLWCYLAYYFGRLLSSIPIEPSEDSDKKFFEKVKKENKDIKLSEIPKEYSPNLEEKLKQGEQEVTTLTEELENTKAHFEDEKKATKELTNEKIQLEGKLNSIQQSLVKKTEELESTNKKVLQLDQELGNAKQNLDKITGEFENSKKELDKQISKVTELNVTIKECNETNIKLEKNVETLNDQLTKEKVALGNLKAKSEQNEAELKKKIEELNSINQGQTIRITELTAEITELKEAKTKLEEKVKSSEKSLQDTQAQLKERKRELEIATSKGAVQSEDLKQVQQNLAAETKKFENTVNELRKGLNEKISEVDQLTKELKGAKDQLAKKEADLSSKIKEVAELTQQRDNLTIVFPKVNDKGIIKYLSYNGI